MTNIVLYSIFVSGSLNADNFTTKLSAILNHNYNDVSGNFNSLYSLCQSVLLL